MMLARRAALAARRSAAPVVRGAAPRRHLRVSASRREETVKLTFVKIDGTPKEVEVATGTTLLDAAHDNNVELEGACGGELACSTCHIVFDQDLYDGLPEKTEEEEDMLDLAWGLTDTSRLGCQIKVTADMAGATLVIPDDDAQ